MYIDNYGHLIQEPFHRNRWALECRYSSNSGWNFFRSYRKPIDVDKALTDLRNLYPSYEFRVRKIRYREVKGGFHAIHLPRAANSRHWVNRNADPLTTLTQKENDIRHSNSTLETRELATAKAG